MVARFNLYAQSLIQLCAKDFLVVCIVPRLTASCNCSSEGQEVRRFAAKFARSVPLSGASALQKLGWPCLESSLFKPATIIAGRPCIRNLLALPAPRKDRTLRLCHLLHLDSKPCLVPAKLVRDAAGLQTSRNSEGMYAHRAALKVCR